MYLHAIGHFHPENVVTNAFLESLDIGTNEAWIMERVGIRSRHTVLPLDYIRQTKNQNPRDAIAAATMTNAQTGAKAGRVALERAKLEVKDIGMVLAGSCSPDECIPAEANRVAEVLGVDGPSLDIASACSSFCSQLYFLEAMRPEKLPDFIMLVNPENSTRVVDYTDRSSCVLWGDCSTAAIVSPRVPGPWKVTSTYLKGEPGGADKVKVPRFGHFTQQGAEVQKFAVKRAGEVYEALRGEWLKGGPERSVNDLTFIGHQANLRMLEAVARRCEVPSGRHLYNVDVRGNVGASGAPSVFSQHWGSEALGQAIALCVVGSGLTWAGALFERA
ncbi:MAG: ketoacyl-ACP synthase III [Myxococcaceae bacterium]|nr:ketoacyl-ACP synthase III [Myxococcaceae bacterium]